MNEQRFTVHINFIKSKRFLEKKRVSGLYLNFTYLGDYYKSFASKDMGDRKYPLLATLYTSNKSLMEEFRSRVISVSNVFNIVSDNLLISKSNYGFNFKPDDITFMPYNPSQNTENNHKLDDDLLTFLASHGML